MCVADHPISSFLPTLSVFPPLLRSYHYTTTLISNPLIPSHLSCMCVGGERGTSSTSYLLLTHVRAKKTKKQSEVQSGQMYT
mmetsp:Transcript_6892/g.17403  ORF Transcript_6892/g.17403 Transcript_6892/m.17403 type:complete len:82 (-) Transcript_6892:224-469(-)